jgi:hypothetical protein
MLAPYRTLCPNDFFSARPPSILGNSVDLQEIEMAEKRTKNPLDPSGGPKNRERLSESASLL